MSAPKASALAFSCRAASSGDSNATRSDAMGPSNRGSCSSRMRRRISSTSSIAMVRPPTAVYQRSHSKGEASATLHYYAPLDRYLETVPCASASYPIVCLAAVLGLAVLSSGCARDDRGTAVTAAFEFEEVTIPDCRTRWRPAATPPGGSPSSTSSGSKRSTAAGPALRSVIEINPDALRIADALDAERKTGAPRGPLHGIPVLIKDNIDTADRMTTTAGSLALVGVDRRRATRSSSSGCATPAR